MDMEPQTTTQTRKRKRRPKAAPTLPWRLAALGVLTLLMVLAIILRLTGHGDDPAPSAALKSEAASETQEGRPFDDLFTYAFGITSVPVGYHKDQIAPDALTTGTLLLVNNEHGYDAGAVTNLDTVYESMSEHLDVKDTALSVNPLMLSALNRWIDAGYEENGLDSVVVVAGYRSYDMQKELYDNAVANHGEDYAKQYISRPGASEHHTGYAVDLSVIDRSSGTTEDFSGTGAEAWLAEHAWEYGLILRYPMGKTARTGIAYESWHYRYVGLPHAKYITDHELCLEEYIDLLRQYPASGEHLKYSCLGREYEIYFCKAGTLVLPDNSSYMVSGNNVDGYIVTVIVG